MLDLTTETPLSLAAATGLIPPGRGGERTHLSTLLRWILHGSKGPDGETVRLEAVRLGSRWVTSREAIQRFSERLTPHLDRDRAEAPRTPGRRQRAADRAGRELDVLGIR
jgi:hypothetical protein